MGRGFKKCLFPLYESKKLLYNTSDKSKGGGTVNCVKCGKKTEGTNVFCAECLEGMKRYPVKPGTKVHIPVRAAHTERKQPQARKERTPEEQITALHKLVQVLVIMVACLTTTLAVTVGVLVYALTDEIATEPQQTPMSRNYTTTAPADED